MPIYCFWLLRDCLFLLWWYWYLLCRFLFQKVWFWRLLVFLCVYTGLLSVILNNRSLLLKNRNIFIEFLNNLHFTTSFIKKAKNILWTFWFYLLLFILSSYFIVLKLKFIKYGLIALKYSFTILFILFKVNVCIQFYFLTVSAILLNYFSTYWTLILSG